MRIPFRTPTGHQAAVLSEAHAMLEAGLDRDTVLAVFERESDWLAPMLEFSDGLCSALDAEPASYYFEASLKTRFLEAAQERRYRPVAEPAPRSSRVRTGFASATVLAGTAAAAFAALGFVTADDAVPGDWNYGFKTSQERVEYALARGDSRVDIQIHQAQARVYEIQVLTNRGQVSPEQIQKLENEVVQLKTQIEKAPVALDDVQKQRVKSVQELSAVVLSAASEKNENVKPDASRALTAVNEAAVAAGVGTTVAIANPSPTASPEATETATGVVALPESTVVPIPEATSTSLATTAATVPVTPAATAPPAMQTVIPETSTPLATATATPAATTTPGPTLTTGGGGVTPIVEPTTTPTTAP